MLGVVDLPAVERRPRAVLLRLGELMERVEGRSARAAKDAGHQVRIVRREFLHCLGTVIRDLEEHRPTGAGNAGKRADDQVVDEASQVGGALVAARVGVEDFEEMPETYSLGLDAEFLIRQQRWVIE